MLLLPMMAGHPLETSFARYPLAGYMLVFGSPRVELAEWVQEVCAQYPGSAGAITRGNAIRKARGLLREFYARAGCVELYDAKNAWAELVATRTASAFLSWLDAWGEEMEATADPILLRGVLPSMPLPTMQHQGRLQHARAGTPGFSASALRREEDSRRPSEQMFLTH